MPTTWRLQLLGIAVVAPLSCASAQSADVVLLWNEIAQQTVAPAAPPIQSRSLAVTHLAVLEALEEVAGGNIANHADGASTAVQEAAVMAAAHEVLKTLHPDSAAVLDMALAEGLSGIADEAAVATGTAIGRAAADSILEQRGSDGWDAAPSYTPASGPGVWVPTPPALAAAQFPHWGDLVPFALESGDQFRPGPPYGADSPEYQEELREVFEVGAVNSSLRSAELTEIAKFWSVSRGSSSWNAAARQLSAARGDQLLDNAYNLALLNVAIADAFIACFDAKYTYNLWRPVTAIHAGVGKIGPAADWLPLIATPGHPAYPSAHACVAGAAGTILERLFGPDGHDIVLTAEAMPDSEFRFDSLGAIADAIDDARVYGGIHTQQDQAAGRELGAKVALFVYDRLHAAGQ